jgi:hypothetical protein
MARRCGSSTRPSLKGSQREEDGVMGCVVLDVDVERGSVAGASCGSRGTGRASSWNDDGRPPLILISND